MKNVNLLNKYSEPCIMLKNKRLPVNEIKNIKTYLYNRYSSSQNYYYSKIINNIITFQNKPKVINYNDIVLYDKSENLLIKLYNKIEYKKKILYLIEYYKFHNDLPRNFMLPVSIVLHHYYDKKRKINFIKIKKLLENNLDSDTQYSISDSSFRANHETVRESLLFLLPKKLKVKLERKKKEKEMKENLNLSSTLYELNDFLGSIFESEDFCEKSNFLKNKRKLKIENNSFFEEEESISKNFFGKGFKKIGENIIFGKNMDFLKNEKFLRNLRIKMIMKNKLKKNTFLKKFAKTKIKSNIFKKNKKQNFMISLPVNETKMLKNSDQLKKYQNFNINNLNININFDPKKNPNLKKKKILKKKKF